MRAIVTMILLVVVLVLGVMVLSGCESPAAQRMDAEARLVQAEAARERARAEADVARLQARADAEASLAATRQMERDAAHQRMVESLIALSLGVLPLSLAAGAVMFLLAARQRYSLDPTLLVYLDRLQLRQAVRERELWHALATMQRRQLPAGEQVVVLRGKD